MSDDVQICEGDCPSCGNSELLGQHCFDCNEFGEATDCCDDLCQGDHCIHGDYRLCDSCHGTQFIRWCSKCGKTVEPDIATALEQVLADQKAAGEAWVAWRDSVVVAAGLEYLSNTAAIPRKIADMRAERDRLRAALQEIADNIKTQLPNSYGRSTNYKIVVNVLQQPGG